MPSPPKVLIVDDQVLNVQLLHQMLAGDYQVFFAFSGEDALTVCSRELPDVLLLDLRMPGMGGAETCRRLKAESQFAHMPVLFVTASDTEEDESQALASGGADVLRKPVNPTLLKARIQTHLKLRAFEPQG